MAKDYYSILGISKNASKDDIKKAFRKLAHKYHPDKGQGNDAKFKEASEAYSILSDEQKRAQYDTYGQTFAAGGGGPQGGSGGFEGFDFGGFSQQGGQNGFEFNFEDLGDIFGDFFGGGRRAQTKRGRDVSIDIELDFKESIFGVEKHVLITKTSICERCQGNRAEKNSEILTCKKCNGKGTIREMKRSIFGQISATRTCDECQGVGAIPKEKCALCKGAGVRSRQEDIKIQIPAGIENGEMIRMPGRGEAITGGAAGDLYVKVHVRKHKNIHKEGSNLIMDLGVKLSDALTGAEYKIETLDGNIALLIPEGIKFGEVLRVRGKGVPVQTNKRGDLLVQINILMPNKLSRDAKKLIDELRKEGI